MNQAVIEKYLSDERGVSRARLQEMVEKIMRHQDIAAEFETWIQQRNYDFEHPIIVEGYTAKQIYELAPFLDGIGVYNFLITLREEPETAKKYIAEEFRVL